MNFTIDVGVSELRLGMNAEGQVPLPARGKEVLLPGWSNKTNVSAEEIISWAKLHPDWPNTGMLTRNTPAVDVDIKHPQAAEAVEDMIRDLYGDRGVILTRFGLAPKRAMLFKTNQPFTKIRADFVAPDGSKHAIEVLGDGQQLIVAGIHPDTKRPYRWHGDYAPWNIPRDDLPEINEAEARTLVSLASEVLIEKFGFQLDTGPSGHGPNTSEFIVRDASVDVETELAGIHHGSIHDTWKRCAGSLLRHGMSADDAFRKIMAATTARCQDDPRKKFWAKKLASVFTWYLETSPRSRSN
jgi:hypothetical protein